MPDIDYFDYDEDILSRADNTTDVLGYDAIGGVGQLIYHLFRFKEYDLDYTSDGLLIARPYCQKGYEPELYTKESPTGAELTASIYNLAKKIDDFSEKKPYTELIVDWCKQYGHPYAIDSLHAYLTDPQYKLDVDGRFVEKDGTFSIEDFMHDLERFYQAMRMQFAFEQMCLGYDEAALELHEDGRHFAGLPFFEQYKFDPDDYPEIDYTAADGDLLKEMELAAEATKDRVCGDGFRRTPFDYYEELQEIIVDLIPDFRIRLKVNPRTRRMVFAADVHSVFDICWYTLARKLSEDVAPEDKGLQPDEKKKPEGVVMSCPFCGEAFIRKWNRSVTCGKAECNKARQRKNKQNSRKKQKILAQQSK